ncbi:MAG: hypothetical protein LBF22_01985, partial [Deltaproteobacteria bacterium]|nr:hypothetical protein [Deltaproteobacteria bacterium]
MVKKINKKRLPPKNSRTLTTNTRKNPKLASQAVKATRNNEPQLTAATKVLPNPNILTSQNKSIDPTESNGFSSDFLYKTLEKVVQTRQNQAQEQSYNPRSSKVLNKKTKEGEPYKSNSIKPIEKNRKSQISPKSMEINYSPTHLQRALEKVKQTKQNHTTKQTENLENSKAISSNDSQKAKPQTPQKTNAPLTQNSKNFEISKPQKRDLPNKNHIDQEKTLKTIQKRKTATSVKKQKTATSVKKQNTTRPVKKLNTTRPVKKLNTTRPVKKLNTT